jgi:hypothetical protein
MSRWTATRIAAHTTSLLRDARLILVSVEPGALYPSLAGPGSSRTPC